jgi:mRNA-degrading endonuclease RelE of RelBE toxin-antitoxin system
MSDGSDGAFACHNAPDKMRDRTVFYRYRIGDYRVIYSINDQIARVLVVAIAHRDQAYE